MIVECQKCGAPLSVVEGQRLVQCAYCGATSQVRSTRTMAQQTPPGWQPPPVWQPPPQAFQPPPPTYVYRPAAPVPARAGGAVAALAVAGAFVSMGVVGAFVARGGGAFATRVDPSAPATVATIPLGGEPAASRAIPGVAGGPIRGGSIDTRCRGYFPVAPQFSLRLTSNQRVRVTTLGGNDLTMAMRDPSGTFRCDDDSGSGSNPLLDVPLPPGVYPVWIGTYRQNTTAAFTLQLQSGDPGASPFADGILPAAPPTLGVVSLAGASSAATRAGIAGGPIDAHTLGSSCRGYISAAPHLVVRATEPRSVVLLTAATQDLTMVVRDASGAFHCDDDSGGGRQPRVTTPLGPGDHQVWIGTYSANESGTFTLSVQSATAGSALLGAGLSPLSPPTLATLDLDRAPPSTALRGSVAGGVDAQQFGPACRGYVTEAPQLRLRTRSPRHVTLTATSGADLTLLARGPNGDVVCVDDTNGSVNPTLDADIAAGDTTVWIGTYNRARSVFRVQVSTGPSSGALPVK